MSIPERFTRIVRHKISEIKDKFDQMDEEALADPAEMERLRRAEARLNAKQELEDSMTEPTPISKTSDRTTNPKVDVGRQSLKPQGQLRSPKEITDSSNNSTANRNAQSSADYQESEAASLDAHYRLLGLEPGADLSDVQKAYTSLTARTDPTRFPAGTAEAKKLVDIRSRLEISYKALRESLDATAHRFGLLEFDAKPNTD